MDIVVHICGLYAGEVDSGTLKIGAVTIPIYNPLEKMKVPDVLFYENTQVSADLSLTYFGQDFNNKYLQPDFSAILF